MEGRTRGLQPSRTPAARHLSPRLAPRGLINWRFHLASVSVCPLRKAKTRRPAPGAGSAGRTGPGPGALFSAGGRSPGPDPDLRSHRRRGGEGGGALGARGRVLAPPSGRESKTGTGEKSGKCVRRGGAPSGADAVTPMSPSALPARGPTPRASGRHSRSGGLCCASENLTSSSRARLTLAGGAGGRAGPGTAAALPPLEASAPPARWPAGPSGDGALPWRGHLPPQGTHLVWPVVGAFAF